jgi:acetolactate synthase I/II/III large subunit
MFHSSNKLAQTGAQLVVRALEAQGVAHVFGVPGAKIDAVFNALVDSKIKTVVCRHEQKCGVHCRRHRSHDRQSRRRDCDVRPGRLEPHDGAGDCQLRRDPVVALGGAVATGEALKQIHQTMDAVSILKPVTKYSVTVGPPDQVSEVMANAFRVAESGRPGAAYVNLPMDMMAAPCAH